MKQNNKIYIKFFLLISLCIFKLNSQNNIPMNYLLKKATDSDFVTLHNILVVCGEHMFKSLKLRHWYPYASLEKFKEKVKYSDVYCVFENEKMVATFSLSTTPRDYYKLSMWQDQNAKAIYLGNLGILPELQGKGLGKWCLNEVEKIAKEMNCKAIRFDCVEKHPWLSNFYEKLGFARKCIVNMPEPTGNLICFEKVIL